MNANKDSALSSVICVHPRSFAANRRIPFCCCTLPRETCRGSALRIHRPMAIAKRHMSAASIPNRACTALFQSPGMNANARKSEVFAALSFICVYPRSFPADCHCRCVSACLPRGNVFLYCGRLQIAVFGRAKLPLSRTRQPDSGSAGASPSQRVDPQFSAAPSIPPISAVQD